MFRIYRWSLLPAVTGWIIALGTTPAGAQMDLIVDQPALAATWHIVDVEFPPGHCAIVEACVGGPGVRRLLRFATKTANIGMGDLTLGDPETDPRFHFSPCHGHYHFDDFTSYQLFDSSDNIAAPGHKQAFCILDTQQYVFEPWVGPRMYTCAFQGLSGGWADTYAANLDCQWIDVTNVPAGEYSLRVSVNPEGTLEETNLANNVSSAPVTLPATTGMPPRPDGNDVPGSPMIVGHAAGGSIRVDHDAAFCPAPQYNLYYGQRQDSGWSYAYTGAVCGIGTSGTAFVDPPDPPAGDVIWFLVVGAEPATGREGGHGFDSAGIERPLSAAGLCGVQRTHSGPACPAGSPGAPFRAAGGEPAPAVHVAPACDR